MERKQKRYERRSQKRNEKRRNAIRRFDNFELLLDPDNLYRAYRKSKLGVSWKESVQRYGSCWLRNIAGTRKKLANNEPVQSGFVEFDIHERGKARHIKSVHISERVVQKCLCDQVLVPVLSRSLIYDNGASLRNKGVHFSLRRLKVHLARYYRKNGFSNEGYVLSIDFSKFFDSIRHDLLLGRIGKYIKDGRLFKCVERFVTIFGDNVSLGLGSQISQICAIFYPSGIDHYIKEKLGIKFYGRYMDDMYLIHKDKDYLQKCLKLIVAQCARIGLSVNTRKTRITALGQGLVFLKGRYSLRESGKIVCLPCRDSTARVAGKLKKFRSVMNSGGRIGLKDIGDSYRSWRNTFMRRFAAYYRVRKMDSLYMDCTPLGRQD
jgi:hypothetical protein